MKYEVNINWSYFLCKKNFCLIDKNNNKFNYAEDIANILGLNIDEVIDRQLKILNETNGIINIEILEPAVIVFLVDNSLNELLIEKFKNEFACELMTLYYHRQNPFDKIQCIVCQLSLI